MTTSTTTSRPDRSAPSAGRAIATRALLSPARIVAALAFYCIVMGLVIGLLWEPLQDAFAGLVLPPELTEVLPGADLTTPAGWANAEFLSLVAPGFLIAVAVVSGMRATAAEEESKTLGMSLSAPVSRTTFLAAKSVATALLVTLMGLFVLAGLWVADLSGDLGLSASGMVAASVHATMLGLVIGAVTIAAGVLTGKKRPTMVIGAGFAGLSFAIASFFPLSEALTPWARVSPWYHYNASNPLVNGAEWGSLLVLAITAAAVLAIAFYDFPRRDLHG